LQLIHQGIRGLASLIVVVAHGYEAFGWPEHSFDRPYIFQIPFIRLILDGGYLAVCIFFLLSGYLCAMKPLRLLRAGKPDEARRAIASGALRRLVRLGIPATLATTFSWFLTQIGAFTVSTQCWQTSGPKFGPTRYPAYRSIHWAHFELR
jgi:peptidoglycan/LPS O-acetylase OafA/YrhL